MMSCDDNLSNSSGSISISSAESGSVNSSEVSGNSLIVFKQSSNDKEYESYKA